MPPRPERHAWSDAEWAEPPAMPWLNDWVALATGAEAAQDARQDRRAALAHADMTAQARATSRSEGDVGRYAFLGGDGGGGGSGGSAALVRSRSLRTLETRQTPQPPPPAANLPFCVGPCMAFANIGDCGSHANFTCLCQSEVYVHSVMQCWAVRCNATGYNIAISYSASTCAALGVEMRLGANGASIDVTGAPVIFSKVAFNISAVMSSLCSLLLAGALVLGFFSCRAQARKHAALGSMATYPWMDTGKGRGRRTEEPMDMEATVDFYEMFAPPRRPAPAATSASGAESSSNGAGSVAGAAGAAAPGSNAPSTRAHRFSNRDPILPGELDFSAFDGVVSDASEGEKARSPVSDKDWAEGGSDKSAAASADDVVDDLPLLDYLPHSATYTVLDTPTTVHMVARESVPDSIAATTAAAAESTTALNPVPAPYEAPPPLSPMPPPPAAAPPRTPPPPPPAAASPASTPRPIPHPFTRSADSPGRGR